MPHVAPMAASEMLARSYLFVPGDRPERFANAVASGADAVVIDLEDAVATGQKAVARNHLSRWLDAGVPAWVRINAWGSAWFADDVAACVGRAAGVLLPKAETADQIAACRAAGIDAPIVPIIESAIGFGNLDTIASSAVLRLAFGAIDLAADLGIDDDERALDYFRSRLVLASRLANLPAPIDGVTTAVADEHALARDTQRARNFGFGARLCIHPRQVAGIHAGLAPTAAQLAWAHRVTDASRSQGAAFALEGRMVDRPVLLQALAWIARASRAD